MAKTAFWSQHNSPIFAPKKSRQKVKTLRPTQVKSTLYLGTAEPLQEEACVQKWREPGPRRLDTDAAGPQLWEPPRASDQIDMRYLDEKFYGCTIDGKYK